MKSLIIAEKPSVAADIAQALGGFGKDGSVWERGDLIVSSAVGHLVELDVPEAENTARGFAGLPVIPNQFSLSVIERAATQYKLLEKLMRRNDVGCVINACDAGREGELIFRLILEKARCTKPTKRMWFQSMTHETLREAFDMAKPGEEFDALADAARSRSEADWLIGINASRGVMTLREQQTGRRESSSAGRVQTPTLALVVDRENEINNFVAQDYWEVVGTFGVGAGEYKGKWKGKSAPGDGDQSAEEADAARSRFFDRSRAQELVSLCAGQPVDYAQEESKPSSKPPPFLFDLTSLQREANKRFKFPIKKTLDIAQALYEKHKVTTYPRTDSKHLPEDYLQTAEDVVRQMEGSPWGRYAKAITDSGWVQLNKRIFDNSKISDHFAIIPTGVLSDQLSPDEQRVYELIVKRFLAAFFPNAEFINTSRVTVVAGQPFYSSGKVMTYPGWLNVMQEVDDAGDAVPAGDKGLCVLAEGEVPTNNGIDLTSGRTSPPSRYTEASLLTAMETAGKLVEDEEMRAAMKDKGLGTPATRAATIEGLLDDGSAYRRPREPYMRRDKTFLVPTPKAMSLIEFLRACGAGFLASPETTGEWEELLNKMSRGEFPRDQFMEGIRQTTRDLIAILQGEASKMPAASASRLQAMCPKCKSGVMALPGGFRCESSCGYEQRREVATRPLSDAEMTQLLNGELLALEGFFSSTKKRKFNAGLRMLEDGKLEFDFDQAASSPQTLSCACPKCDSAMSTKPALVECSNKDCGFKVWRELCKRKFSDAELEKLLTKGSLTGLKGFVSPKTGNKFDAGITLSLEGKLDFVFAKR